MDERGDAADEPRTGLQRLLGVLFEIVLDGKDTLRRQLLDLSLAVVVPVYNTACQRLVPVVYSEASSTYQSST